MDQRLVPTPVGAARLDWFSAEGLPRATVVLGHGTATGVEAMDLQALDRAWTAIWPSVSNLGVPLISGGPTSNSSPSRWRITCSPLEDSAEVPSHSNS